MKFSCFWRCVGVAFCLSTASWAVAQSSGADGSPKTVRICDDRGCAERPINSATFDTPANAVQPVSPQLQALIQKADADPRAAYDLALRYFRGDGVTRDSYQALQWMRKAGDGGVLPAQLALGRFYLTGLEEMGADPAEAASWLERAAIGGSAEAKPLLQQARSAEKDAKQDYAQREKEKNTWYILWSRTAPYYWYWQDRAWVCHFCR